ncbi:hypothetical protein OBBRIDRAFT_887285, partial [Obba rivulosa]
MPEATGTIVRDNKAHSLVAGTWDLGGGSMYTFTFNLSNSVPMFKSSEATLSYNNTDNLTGTRKFQGYIGNDDVSLSIDAGSTVQGLTTSTLSGIPATIPLQDSESVYD